MSPLMQPTLEDLKFTDEEWEKVQQQGFNSPELALEVITPNCIGPTWECDAFGNWVLPERTLGWQVAGWTADYLIGPDGGPWEFTLEQLRFVLWWYAVDYHGRFIYRTGVLQRMKGWGKDPLLAVLCLVEFAGPSRVVAWDEDHQPIGGPVRNPFVQVTAVSLDQTTNTMDLIPDLMSDRFKREYDVKLGIELIRGRVNKKLAKIQAVTASPRSCEGKRTTFTLLNETHHWLENNKGHKMFEVIDGNATKMKSRYLAITNAFLPGEDSIGEKMREQYEDIVEGRSPKKDFLYDSVEAHALAPVTGPLLPLILERIRGDAIWSPIEDIISSIHDTTIPLSRSRRMWLNQVVAEEDSLHDIAGWDSLIDEDLQRQYEKEGPLGGLKSGDEIVIGFDGSKREDATAIVVMRIKDAAVFLYALWEPPRVTMSKKDEEWEVNREEVDSAIHEIFRNYKVRAFHADVAQWESYIASWSDLYGDLLAVNALGGKPIAWDMRTSLKESTMAHERLMDSIVEKKIKHNGDRRLKRHVLNTRRRENNFGLSFGKESRRSRRKVDAYAALMLAHEAYTNFKLKGKVDKPKTRRGYFV